MESAVRLIPIIDDVTQTATEPSTFRLQGPLLGKNQRIKIFTGAIFQGSLKIERDLHLLQPTRIFNLDEGPLIRTDGTDERQYHFVTGGIENTILIPHRHQPGGQTSGDSFQELNVGM